MASLRYHAGRMVLYEEEPTVWRVKIKTKQGKLNLPLKDKKTKKFTFIVKGVGIGTAPMKISTQAETQAKAVKYIKARWKDCSYELI